MKGYLLLFENYINNLLSEKYDDNIIKGSYDYYKNDTRTKIENLLNIIGDKWESIFDSLNKEIKDNINDISSGTFEFGMMAQLTSVVINGNIIRNFYNSRINHQKNEFRFTISYYYNYLLRSIKSAYKYVLSAIPSNDNGFNDIINLRKNEIITYFENLIKKITTLKEKSCSEKKQIEVLQISEKNFFEINDILNNNIKNLNESLTIKASFPFNYLKENNEYSFINRFYLENSLIGAQLKSFYEEIEDKSFIKLKIDEFINLIKENLIFDKNEFINKIEEIINILESNINNLFYKEKKNYTSILEKIISDIFTKDKMIQEIIDLYKKSKFEIENNKIQEINNNINEILDKIKERISSEASRLLSTAVSYTKDYSKIYNTIKEYENEIFNKLNRTVMSVIEDFH